MRDIINKYVPDQQVLDTAHEIYKRGWRTIKLYFMIGHPSETLDDVRARFREAYARSYTPGSSLRQFAAIVEAPDREDALQALAVPTLVMHGTLDPLVGMDGGERLAALVPGATFLPIEGLAHDLPVQVWQQVISAVTAHVSQHAS
jgi:pimeloyl-ACP methyl ester carboxylesterase